VTDKLSLAFKHLSKAIQGQSCVSVIFKVDKDTLRVASLSKDLKLHKDLQETIRINTSLTLDNLKEGSHTCFLPTEDPGVISLNEFFQPFEINPITLIGVSNFAGLQGLVVIGARKGGSLSPETIQACEEVVKLAEMAIAHEEGDKKYQPPSNQIKILTALSQVSISNDLNTLFQAIHSQVMHLIGDYAFIAALYDEKTASIQIPYNYEDKKVSSIETFPLGEGLTSILIHTQQPLLLNDNVEKRAVELGAKTTGKSAKSWLGVPVTLNGKVIGAFIVQDLKQENMFQEKDIETLALLAHHAAGFIHNQMLLDESRRQVFQIQTAAQIARDISSALNLDELLLRAVNLIHERLNFYHAGIFLVDHSGKNVVIREATGDAGAQMKRNGHKLVIGSKSIVGFVAGQGDPLVVNDTAKDATHLPNPLLPETRAEAAIPLKIGDKIFGVLDVQSDNPFSFGPFDMDTLQILADQLAIAVNNSELFAETQEHLSQHRLLHHITTSAASGTTLEEALTSAAKGLQVSLGGDRVIIFLADPEHKNLIPKAWVGYSNEIVNQTIPIGVGITGWVAAHRKNLRIDNIIEDTRYIKLSPNTRSEMAIPLIFRNELLGVLNVESEQAAAYSENDEEMLGTLAGSLAAIIANGRLLEQIRRQAERERLLYEITSKIRQSTDTHSILMTTVGELSRATNATKAKISIGIREDRQDNTAKS